MTNDIVERLREWAQYPVGARRSIDLLEAAAEIERLRETNAAISAAALKEVLDWQKAEIERLRKHVKELETIFLPDRLTGNDWRANNDHYNGTADGDQDWG